MNGQEASFQTLTTSLLDPVAALARPRLFRTITLLKRQPGDIYSRPDSRNGMHQQSHGRRDSFNSGYYSGEEMLDDGAPLESVRRSAKWIGLPSQTSTSNVSLIPFELLPALLRASGSTDQFLSIPRPCCRTAHLVKSPFGPPTPIPTGKGGQATRSAKKDCSQ